MDVYPIVVDFMPHTPKSPKSPQVMANEGIQSIRSCETGCLCEWHLPDVQDRGGVDACKTISFDWQAPDGSCPSTEDAVKLEDKVKMTENSPASVQLTQTELIRNPFWDLHRYGVPQSYVREHIKRISSSFFNDRRGAAVWVRSRPVNPASRRNNLRVRIVPRHDPSAAFYMSVRSTSTFLDETQIDAFHDAEGASAVPQMCAENVRVFPIIPLHTEVALLRAPLIGRLLLSGKVSRGDLLEIEMQCPESFPEVMYWMYTGKMRIGKEQEIADMVKILSGVTKKIDLLPTLR